MKLHDFIPALAEFADRFQALADAASELVEDLRQDELRAEELPQEENDE